MNGDDRLQTPLGHSGCFTSKKETRRASLTPNSLVYFPPSATVSSTFDSFVVNVSTAPKMQTVYLRAACSVVLQDRAVTPLLFPGPKLFLTNTGGKHSWSHVVMCFRCSRPVLFKFKCKTKHLLLLLGTQSIPTETDTCAAGGQNNRQDLQKRSSGLIRISLKRFSNQSKNVYTYT